MADVFISYSRKDCHFVDKIVGYLEGKNLKCWLDTKDLPPAEVWRKELQDAIIDADNFVFVISPDSNDSEHCHTEIDWAVNHNKRMIPILYLPLSGDQKAPAGILKWQWLEIDRNDEEKSFGAIASAIRNEQKWYKQGTEYLRGARKWEAGQEVFLARLELEDARAWIEKGTSMKPGPSELQIKYIHESEAYHLREAERWEELYSKAIARQLAAQAQFMIQHDAPALTERGLLLAIESMARFQKVGLRSLEADQAMREGLAIMARPVARCKSEHDVDSNAIAANSADFTVAFGDKHGRLCLWKPQERNYRKLVALNSTHTCVEFSEDGKWLAAGTGNGSIYLMNFTENKAYPLKALKEKGAVSAICFSRDSTCFAAALGRKVAVWELNSSDEPVLLDHGSESQVIVSMAFDPSAEVLVTQPVMQGSLCWKWRERRIVGRLDNMGNHVAFSPDGRFLGVSSASTYEAKLWDVYKQEYHTLATNAAKLVFSEDNRFAAIASPEHFARIWKLPELTFIQNLQHNAEVWDLDFSPDSKYIVTKDKEGVAYVWDINKGKQIARLILAEPLKSVRFFGDSRYVLTHSGNETLTIWETQNLREEMLLRHEVAVLGVAFCPEDYRLLATQARSSQFGRSYALINWTTQQLVDKYAVNGEEIAGNTYAQQLIENHKQKPDKKVLSPNGERVAVAEADQVQILASGKNEKAVSLLKHDRKVLRMVFSPDSNFLLTVSDHDTIRIWDIETGQEVSRLTHANPNIVDADFSSDGKYIATASWDFTARIWLWQPV